MKKAFLFLALLTAPFCWQLCSQPDCKAFLKHFGHTKLHIHPSYSITCRYCRDEVFDKVFKIHKKSLPFLHEPHPRFMILFSGTPGMGKSVVARRLEEKFHALRLSTDDIRPILRELKIPENFANTYLARCAQKIIETEPNHFFVFDKSIDRTFESYSRFAKQNNFTTFVIQMSVQRPLVEERIRSRGKDVENILSQLDFAWENFEEFGTSHEFDFVFVNNDLNIEPSLNLLFQKIKDKVLKQQLLIKLR